jgi:hypothetical protein
MNKKVIIVLVCILFGVIELKPAYADTFYPSGDVKYCELVTAVGLAIGDLPASGSNNIEYKLSDVAGEQSSWVISHTIHDVANVYAGSLRRYPNVAGTVSVPPGTRVDVGLWWLNFSGHSIDTGTSYLYINSGSGGLISVLDVSSPVGSVNYLHNNTSKTRNGNRIEVPSLGALSNTTLSGAPVGRVIASGIVKKPLRITNEKAECVFDAEGKVVISKYVAITNTSQFPQDNLSIANIADSANIASGQEKLVRVDENIGYIYTTTAGGASVSVYNPNFNTACATAGGGRGDDIDPNAHLFFVRRNDSANRNWFGFQTDIAAVPKGDFFCVRQIPYTEKVGGFVCTLPEKVLLQASSDKKELHPGESSTVIVNIENKGISKHSELLTITYPDVFDQYITVNGGEKLVGNGEVKITYEAPEILTDRSWQITQDVLVKPVLPYDLPENIQLRVEYGGEVDTVEYKIVKNTSVVSSLEISNYCSNVGTLPANLKIVVGGNVMLKALVVKHIFETGFVDLCDPENVSQGDGATIVIGPPQNKQLVFVDKNGVSTPIVTQRQFMLSEFQEGSLKILGDIYPGEIVLPIEIVMSSFVPKLKIVSTVCVEGTSLCNNSTFSETCGTAVQCPGITNEDEQLSAIIHTVEPKADSIIHEVIGNVLPSNIVSQVLSVWNKDTKDGFTTGKLSEKLAVTGTDIRWVGYLLCTAFLIASIALVLTAKSVFRSYVRLRPKNCENKYS